MWRDELTDVMIAGLRPPERGRSQFCDTVLPRLRLLVYPAGRKVFYFVYSAKHRKRWHRIGQYGLISLKKARIKGREIACELDQGRDPADARAAERKVETFAEVHARFLEQKAKLKNKSWRQAEYLIRANVLPLWGKWKITDVAVKDALTLHSDISKNRPQTANQVLLAASAVFKFAKKQQIVQTNPCDAVEYNPRGERKRVLSDSELPLFSTAFDDHGLVAATALKVILLTGQRGGEVRRMRWEHVSQDGCWWELPGNELPQLGWPGTKNKRDHHVYLTKIVRDLIADLVVGEPPTSGFVFATDTGRAVSELDEPMRAINAKLEIADPVTPHDLRRTWATRAGEAGVDERDIARVLNHRAARADVPRVTKVYNRHPYAAENMRAMDRTADLIMAVIEGRKDDNVITADFRR
jgi:integrase